MVTPGIRSDPGLVHIGLTLSCPSLPSRFPEGLLHGRMQVLEDAALAEADRPGTTAPRVDFDLADVAESSISFRTALPNAAGSAVSRSLTRRPHDIQTSPYGRFREATAWPRVHDRSRRSFRYTQSPWRTLEGGATKRGYVYLADIPAGVIR